jgi:type IV pilus assembly protein PilC
VQLSFRQKAQLFHELAQLAKSGIPLTKGFEIMSRSPSRIAQAARRVSEELKAAGSVSRAFLAAGFPAADGAVLEAGESTGRLEQIFRELAQYYEQLAEARKRLIKRSVYPVLMLHLAAVLLSIAPAILEGGMETFLKGVFSLLFVIYAFALVAGTLLWMGKRAFALNAAAGQIVAAIPIFGGLLTAMSAWKFSMVFSMYVRSGGGMLRGLGIAGACSESAALRNAATRAVERVQAGMGLADAMRSGGLPETLERAIEVGEASGRLDEEIQRAADLFKNHFMGRLDTLAEWIPKIIYIGTVLLVGYWIVQFYAKIMGSVYGILDSV